MMYKTNFIVLVMSSTPHKVIIWDDYERKNRTEIAFNAPIKNVRLRKDMLVVVLEAKTFIFSFLMLKLIEQIETGPNPLGLCGLASAEKAKSKTIAIPNAAKGAIKILTYVAEKSMKVLIQAHDAEIGVIAVNPNGTLIASADVSGRTIKIFSADGGEPLQ